MEFGAFDLDNVGKNGCRALAICGRRASGKTTLLKQVCAAAAASVVLGFADHGTARDYEMPKSMFYNTCDWDALECLLDIQDRRVRQGKQTDALVFFDDICYDRNFFKNKQLRRLMMNGQQLRTTVVFAFTGQDKGGAPSAIRAIIDAWFIAGENNMQARRHIYERAAPQIPDFKTFSSILGQLTHNHGFLVSLRNVRTNDFTKTIHWLRADREYVEDMPVMLCTDAFWKLHEKMAAEQQEPRVPRAIFEPPPLFSGPQQGTQQETQQMDVFPEPLFRIPLHARYPFYPPPPLPVPPSAPGPVAAAFEHEDVR